MTIRNLDRLFHPQSVALFGASEREVSVGGQVARNLLAAKFEGDLFFVNPRRGSVLGQPCFADVARLPTAPDLAIIATPPKTIPRLIGQLGERGTKAAVVITAGFGEGGDQGGAALRDDMLAAAHPHLLRIVGPNCVGLLAPGIGLNASFAHLSADPGKIAFLSQSGAIITAVLDWAKGRGIGFSHLVSMGDMSDVDFGDLLDFLGRDPKVSAIVLYVEAVTNARKFMSAARAAARLKPVVVVKSGRHAEGAKAAASHTGAMAGSDAVYSAAFRRAGLLRVFTLEELFDAVETLATAKAPPGDNLAIVSNGGGLGVLATDTLIDLGGHLAPLTPPVIGALDDVLPATWSRANPVDLIGDAPAERYRKALDILAGDRNIDGLVVLNAPTALASAGDAAAGVIESDAVRSKTVLTSWVGEAEAGKARRAFTAAGIPTYDTPDQAIRAFVHLTEYRRSQEQLMEVPPAIDEATLNADVGTARKIVGTVLAEGRSVLTEPEAKSLLAAYQIPVPEMRTVATPEAAVQAATEIGFPVALKILSPDISHKSDVGGVALDLHSVETVERAAREMLSRIRELQPDAKVDGFTVQTMVERRHAQELILGITEDRQFGPVLLFGHGGTAAEIVDDKALALAPINLPLAQELMARTRIVRLLRGYRDTAAVALDDIALTLVRLSRLAADLPEVAELDINPLLATASGVIALDARVAVRSVEKNTDPGARFAIRPFPTDLDRVLSGRNGEKLRLRPIRPEDATSLIEVFQSMTQEDIRFRFFAPLKALSKEMVSRLTQIDYDREMALVLFRMEAAAAGSDGPSEKPLGIVRILCDPNFDTAEFAITVRTGEGGHGYGYRLMTEIIDYARTRGLKSIHGDVLADNRRMLELAEALGFVRSMGHHEDRAIRVNLTL